MDPASILVASNRGPVSFREEADGSLVAGKGGGGLVGSLAPLLSGSGVKWVAAAMSDADRRAAADGPIDAGGFVYRCLDLPPAVYRQAYEVVANSVLWFVHHHLFDLPRRPRFDRHFREAWDGFRAYNTAFAEAVAAEAPRGGVVLVQDYHLSLLGPMLASRRPDLRSVLFMHTPFADPGWLEVLPDDVAGELVAGMAGNTAVGFHTARWAEPFSAACSKLLGRTPAVFVSPLGPAVENLRRVAESDACRVEGEALEAVVGGRRLIVRVDRIEPSKNILRGFAAFDELLERRPDLRGEVTFAAFCYPSREGLAEYLGYHSEVDSWVAQLNRRWATPDWQPVLLQTTDNFPRSVAALQRYDALLVNPVRDGLNLVAMEGPVLNRAQGVVALSRQAGAWDLLGHAAVGLHPFDISGTADALARALDMGADERRRLSGAASDAATRRSPAHWLEDQLGAVGETLGG